MLITRIAAVAALLTSSTFAGVGDPTLRTDHPHYPGEGAFQTAADCVAFATREVKGGEQERAIAVFQWLLAHQFHLASPQECQVPGVAAGSKNDDYEMVVYDAAKGRFAYGYGLCGTVHAWNDAYWHALGFKSRRRAFPGHTNSEIFYGGSWHTYDTDMAGLVFRKDGVVAGYEDVMQDVSIVAPNDRGLPHYPFAWPGDFDGMKKGWQEIAKKPDGGWYKMYASGYEAMPGIVNVRRGETFTRYFDRDHFGGPAKRRFWHKQKGGPFRDWTFVNNGTPTHNGAKSNSRGNASYCNAEFVYSPDFTSDAWREGVLTTLPGHVQQHPKSPRLRSSGSPAQVTFVHFSPYVIAGDPADDENPMTKPATGGLVVSGNAVGEVALAISTNGGQTWQEIGHVSGAFEKDLTDLAKGGYGWRLRFTLTETAGLDAVTFTTVCQMNQAIYPRLKPGGSRITYRAGHRVVNPLVPDFGLQQDQLAKTGLAPLPSANLKYTPRSAKQRLAYTTTNNKPAHVDFSVGRQSIGDASPRSPEAPDPRGPAQRAGIAEDESIANQPVEIAAAARFQVRSPSPKGCDFRLELSTDGGKTWTTFGRAELPEDNEYSSGWVYGRTAVPALPRHVRAPLVRVHLYAGGYTTGLISAELYGIQRTPSPHAATVTYGWKEGGQTKTHVESMKAGASEHGFNVPTGRDITDDFVRIEVP